MKGEREEEKEGKGKKRETLIEGKVGRREWKEEEKEREKGVGRKGEGKWKGEKSKWTGKRTEKLQTSHSTSRHPQQAVQDPEIRSNWVLRQAWDLAII